MRLVLSNSTMLRRMNDFAKLHEDRLLLHKRAGAIQPHVDKSTPDSNQGRTFVIDNLDLDRGKPDKTLDRGKPELRLSLGEC